MDNTNGAGDSNFSEHRPNIPPTLPRFRETNHQLSSLFLDCPRAGRPPSPPGFIEVEVGRVFMTGGCSLKDYCDIAATNERITLSC